MWKDPTALGSCQVAAGVNQPKPVMSASAAGHSATRPPESTLTMVAELLRKDSSTTWQRCWRYSACGRAGCCVERLGGG
jgi:hypothetical protein